jgi:hypothetical protein
MALFEYNIKYDDKSESIQVTCRVMAVGPGPDRIRFKSNDPKTAILYVGGTPFDPGDRTAPQADTVFRVGKQTKEFEVKKSLTRDKPLRFRCGEAVPVPAKMFASAGGGESATANTPNLKLKSWKGGGGGTPPPDL